MTGPANRPLPNAAQTSRDTVNPAFLGRGWGFPPTFDRFSRSVTMASGDADIQQALWIILSTALGERIMLATFGCDLLSKVFTTLTTTTANAIGAMVTRAIVEWEPRVVVQSVTVTESDQAGWIDITIDYVVSQTNTRSNLVFPFYRLESTLPPPPS